MTPPPARSQRSPWAVVFEPRPAAAVRLFCFAHAGGAAAVYRRWGAAAPDFVEVCAVQLPGRGTRFREPLVDRLDPLVAAAVDGLAPLLERPFALFGHSVGSLAAFEVARVLASRGNPPVRLFASGRQAPHLRRRDQPIHTLPDPDFVDVLREMEGTPEEVLRDPEVLELVLPILRADCALDATYTHREAPPLAHPISAYGGTADASVSESELDAWRAHGTGGFQRRMFRGGHFFLHDDPAAVLEAIGRDLAEQAA